MPPNLQSFCAQTERMNKGWAYKLHGNEALERYKDDPYIHRMIAVEEKWAFIADRLRVLILRDEGGVYIDADAQPISPLDILPVWDMPHVDFVTAVRDPYRPGVALHRGISLIDNTFMASARDGRIASRLVRLYSSKTPKRTGHDQGCEVLANADWTTVILNYKFVYAMERMPDTIFLHDGFNLGSWTDSPKLTFAT